MHGSAVPSEPDELFGPSKTTAQDSGATAQGIEAPSRSGSATPGSPSLDLALASAPPSTKELFKQFMQTYKKTVWNQAQP